MSETKGPEKVASAEQIGLSHREATATPAPSRPRHQIELTAGGQ